MNKPIIRDFGTNVEVFVDGVNVVTLLHDDYAPFTREENIDGLRDELNEKGIDADTIDCIIDGVSTWIDGHSEGR